MTAEPTPWRRFWHAWRAGFGRANLLFAPAWAVGLLLWFDGVALRLLDGPAAAPATGGLVLVAGASRPIPRCSSAPLALESSRLAKVGLESTLGVFEQPANRFILCRAQHLVHPIHDALGR
jgi:hypothetical protein